MHKSHNSPGSSIYLRSRRLIKRKKNHQNQKNYVTQYKVSACSACIGNFLARAQPAWTIFQCMLIMSRQYLSALSACAKKQKGEYLPQSSEEIFFCPVFKSPTHAGFIGVKKWVENLTLRLSVVATQEFLRRTKCVKIFNQ